MCWHKAWALNYIARLYCKLIAGNFRGRKLSQIGGKERKFSRNGCGMPRISWRKLSRNSWTFSVSRYTVLVNPNICVWCATAKGHRANRSRRWATLWVSNTLNFLHTSHSVIMSSSANSWWLKSRQNFPNCAKNNWFRANISAKLLLRTLIIICNSHTNLRNFAYCTWYQYVLWSSEKPRAFGVQHLLFLSMWYAREISSFD